MQTNRNFFAILAACASLLTIGSNLCAAYSGGASSGGGASTGGTIHTGGGSFGFVPRPVDQVSSGGLSNGNHALGGGVDLSATGLTPEEAYLMLQISAAH